LGAIFACKSCVNVIVTCVPLALTAIAVAVGAAGAAADATSAPTTKNPLVSRALVTNAVHGRRNPRKARFTTPIITIENVTGAV
jgi:cytochrome c peroxidase